MKSLNEWSKLKKCKAFNKKLASYDWGPVDKDLGALRESDFIHYRTVSPQDFHKIKRGTCWDYVEAQRDWYEEQNIQHTVYYIEGNNKEKATHTLLIAQVGKQFLWDEASWKSNKGLHFADSEDELLKIACEKHSKVSKDITKIDVYRYPQPKFGLSVKEFMAWVKKNGKRVKTC
jgi:hypothetical protein